MSTVLPHPRHPRRDPVSIFLCDSCGRPTTKEGEYCGKCWFQCDDCYDEFPTSELHYKKELSGWDDYVCTKCYNEYIQQQIPDVKEPEC